MADPQIISLVAGSPAAEGHPLEEVRDQRSPAARLTMAWRCSDYGLTSGYLPLREAYLEHLVLPKGVEAQVENTIIMTGSGQGFT